ncbi:hypothetical protein IEQ34_022610 [Dendrobium chrysotoxum]|uniref:Uncharacterized protein n=1 Tax=Dendrobium chrysotoxum TaxID=161865 RepID=A0AAV7FXZ0_DENCH|nr:hypothetical protein IEQ34_022610 [Dendrobium chrysotoxum]
MKYGSLGVILICWLEVLAINQDVLNSKLAYVIPVKLIIESKCSLLDNPNKSGCVGLLTTPSKKQSLHSAQQEIGRTVILFLLHSSYSLNQAVVSLNLWVPKPIQKKAVHWVFLLIAHYVELDLCLFPFFVSPRFLPGAVSRGWFLPLFWLPVSVLLAAVPVPCAAPSVPPLVACPVAALSRFLCDCWGAVLDTCWPSNSLVLIGYFGDYFGLPTAVELAKVEVEQIQVAARQYPKNFLAGQGRLQVQHERKLSQAYQAAKFFQISRVPRIPAREACLSKTGPPSIPGTFNHLIEILFHCTKYMTKRTSPMSCHLASSNYRSFLDINSVFQLIVPGEFPQCDASHMAAPTHKYYSLEKKSCIWQETTSHEPTREIAAKDNEEGVDKMPQEKKKHVSPWEDSLIIGADEDIKRTYLGIINKASRAAVSIGRFKIAQLGIEAFFVREARRKPQGVLRRKPQNLKIA